jgi:hypothetical protein
MEDPFTPPRRRDQQGGPWVESLVILALVGLIVIGAVMMLTSSDTSLRRYSPSPAHELASPT